MINHQQQFMTRLVHLACHAFSFYLCFKLLLAQCDPDICQIYKEESQSIVDSQTKKTSTKIKKKKCCLKNKKDLRKARIEIYIPYQIKYLAKKCKKLLWMVLNSTHPSRDSKTLRASSLSILHLHGYLNLAFWV